MPAKKVTDRRFDILRTLSDNDAASIDTPVTLFVGPTRIEGQLSRDAHSLGHMVESLSGALDELSHRVEGDEADAARAVAEGFRRGVELITSATERRAARRRELWNQLEELPVDAPARDDLREDLERLEERSPTVSVKNPRIWVRDLLRSRVRSCPTTSRSTSSDGAIITQEDFTEPTLAAFFAAGCAPCAEVERSLLEASPSLPPSRRSPPRVTGWTRCCWPPMASTSRANATSTSDDNDFSSPTSSRPHMGHVEAYRLPAFPPGHRDRTAGIRRVRIALTQRPRSTGPTKPAVPRQPPNVG